MSNKKKDQKGGGKKDKEKQKQRKQMEEEEARRDSQRQQAQSRIQVLENSGILDAYEYFLRAICKNGLPEANIFEFAAQQILKYQKKMKQKEAKKEELGFGPPKSQTKGHGSIEKRNVERMRSPPKQEKQQATKTKK